MTADALQTMHSVVQALNQHRSEGSPKLQQVCQHENIFVGSMCAI